MPSIEFIFSPRFKRGLISERRRRSAGIVKQRRAMVRHFSSADAGKLRELGGKLERLSGKGSLGKALLIAQPARRCSINPVLWLLRIARPEHGQSRGRQNAVHFTYFSRQLELGRPGACPTNFRAQVHQHNSVLLPIATLFGTLGSLLCGLLYDIHPVCAVVSLDDNGDRLARRCRNVRAGCCNAARMATG